MKRTIYFPEIFDMIGDAQSNEEKIAILHKFYQEKGFIDIIRLCYEPKIKWVVTRAEIEYLKYDQMDIADYDLAPTTLFLEARRRLYNFTNQRVPSLKKEKVTNLIARMFSVLHHKEVELFKQMVDGAIQDTGLTENLIREAFPNLLSPAGPKKPGRPVGAKNKVAKVEKPKAAPKKAGRPAGAKNKKKVGRPRVKKVVAKKPPVKKRATRKKVEKSVDKPDGDGV